MTEEYVNCPVCGDCDMRKMPDDDGFIITCTNLGCASNGGDNATVILTGPYEHLRQLESDIRDRDSRINELKAKICEMHEYIQSNT